MKATNKKSNKTTQIRSRRDKAKNFALSHKNLFVAVLLFTLLGTITWKFYYLYQSDSSAPKPYNNYIEIKDQGSLSPPKSTKQTSDEYVQEATRRQLFFSNPRSEQQDAFLVVDAELPERVTGVCRFRFEQKVSVIETTSTLSNASSCGSRLALSRFPQGGTWYVSIQFASGDGLITATQPPFSIYVSR